MITLQGKKGFEVKNSFRRQEKIGCDPISRLKCREKKDLESKSPIKCDEEKLFRRRNSLKRTGSRDSESKMKVKGREKKNVRPEETLKRREKGFDNSKSIICWGSRDKKRRNTGQPSNVQAEQCSGGMDAIKSARDTHSSRTSDKTLFERCLNQRSKDKYKTKQDLQTNVTFNTKEISIGRMAPRSARQLQHQPEEMCQQEMAGLLKQLMHMGSSQMRDNLNPPQMMEANIDPPQEPWSPITARLGY